MKTDKRLQNLKEFYAAKSFSDSIDGWCDVHCGCFVKTKTSDVHIVHKAKNLSIGDQLVTTATTKIAVLVSNFTNGNGRTITAKQWEAEGWMVCEKPGLNKSMESGYYDDRS
jgi:hypothetical protein